MAASRAAALGMLHRHEHLVLCVRRFAAAAAKGAQQRYTAASSGNMRFLIRSSNGIAEPYRGPSTSMAQRMVAAFSPGTTTTTTAAASAPSQSESSPYTLSEDFWGGIKSFYTLARLRKDVKGFTLDGFKTTAGDLYRVVSVALARGDVASRVRNQVTEAFSKSAKMEIKAREAGMKLM